MPQSLKTILRVPEGANTILRGLKRAGYESYVVGGCVRDSLMGIMPKDWDICTTATPDQTMNVFKDRRILKTGLKHGTVTILMEDDKYEVTTFRAEGEYSDSRHPDSVEFVKSVEKDLARRDFTINAMAWNPKDGLKDPFEGLRDLKDGILRCVGNPNERFEEDALRILRALRFASEFGFSIEEKTAKAIHETKSELKKVAVERIQPELFKLLGGKGVLKVLLEFSDVVAEIISELGACIGFEQNNKYHEYDVYEHIANAVAHCETRDPIVRMALLLHDIGKPCCYTEDENGGHFYGHPKFSYELANSALEHLKFGGYTKDSILELVLNHDATIEPTPKTIKRWFNKMGEDQFLRLLKVRKADILAHKKGTQATTMVKWERTRELAEEVLEQNQCFKMSDLVVNGYDVMAILDVKEGKDVGIILNEILEEVMEGRLENERTEIVKYLKCLKRQKGKPEQKQEQGHFGVTSHF